MEFAANQGSCALEYLLVFFTNYSEAFIYFLFFSILFLSGLGLPVPEDAVLLSGGFLIYFGYVNFIPTILIGFFGVLCGDQLVFFVGRRWGTDAVRHKSVAHLLTPKRLLRVQNYFRQYGTMTVLVVRFLPGLRAPTFLLAGAVYMPFRQFFWLDFVAALVSVPLVTYLGYAFAPQFESLLKMFHRVELIVVAIIFMAALLYWFFKIRNRQTA